MKRGVPIPKLIFRIYIIHLSAILAVWLAMYYPGLDIMLSILYLVVLWEEGNYTFRTVHNPLKQAAVAGIWQLPGFILASSVILGWDRLADFAYYFIFILELWVTPILPLISLLPTWTILERPVYYYLFFVIVPILAVYYCLPGLRKWSPNN